MKAQIGNFLTIFKEYINPISLCAFELVLMPLKNAAQMWTNKAKKSFTLVLQTKPIKYRAKKNGVQF